MRAFVTGGTGLLGRHLVEALLGKGWEVAVLTRDPVRSGDLNERGVDIVEGDVTRPRFHAAVARADVLFHLAAWFELGVRDGRRMFDVNVTGTGNLLAMARKESVPRIVFTSTAGLFAPATAARPATEASPIGAAVDDPYVATKLEAHRLVVGEMHAGLPATIVMPAAVFGPGDTNQLGRSLANLVRGRLRAIPRGFGMNTWSHAADVAEGHILAATRGRPGETYILADRVLGFHDFFRLAAAAAGVKAPREVPMAVARLAAAASELSAWVRHGSPEIPRAALELASLDVAVDASRARSELGWRPRALEDRIAETMAWFTEEYVTRRAPLPVKRGDASAGGPPRTAGGPPGPGSRTPPRSG